MRGPRKPFLTGWQPHQSRCRIALKQDNNGFDCPLWLDASFYEDLCAHRLPAEELHFRAPGLIIQGDQDDVVVPGDSIKFAKRNSLDLHIVKGADHRDLDEILSVTTRFLLEDA